MKATSKRLLALLMGMIMVLSLAACGEKTAPTDAPTEKDPAVETTAGGENQPTESEQADPFGKYEEEITLRGAFLENSSIAYIPGNPDYDSAEKNMYITAYKEELGINVEYDWVSADKDAYNTKWNMAMAQKNLPDFGMVYAEQYKMLLDAGLIMDMTDIFEEYASDLYKEFLAADGGATRGYSTQDGKHRKNN